MANGHTRSKMVGLRSGKIRVLMNGHDAENGSYIVDSYPGDKIWFRPPTEDDLLQLEMTDSGEPVMVLTRGDQVDLYRTLHITVATKQQPE